MEAGYIKLCRAIEFWRWGNDPLMVYFWVRILLMANWEDKEWRDTVIKRGSFVSTVASLSSRLNLSVRQVRTCLNRLRAGGEIAVKATNNYTLITICKYDAYQLEATNERQTNDKRTTTTKEVNKIKKEEDTKVSPKKESIDYDAVMAMWNTSMTREVAKIKKISDSRKEKMRLRVAEMGGWEKAQATFEECFGEINESDFCNGENPHRWVATFDWFFENDKNWVKVSEGNYRNKHSQPQPTKPEKILSWKDIEK